LRGSIIDWLKRRTDTDSTEADAVDCPRDEPIPPGSDRLRPAHTSKHRSTLRWAPPEEHAALILDHLQGPGGRTGTIPFKEINAIHREACLERNVEPCKWNPVGEELRQLLGGKKTYDYDTNGKRIRVYRISPKEQQPHLKVLRPLHPTANEQRA
jgi:hypothetical protein